MRALPYLTDANLMRAEKVPPPKEPPLKPVAKKINRNLQHAQARGRETVERDDVETETALDQDYNRDNSEEEDEYDGGAANSDDVGNTSTDDNIIPAVKPARKPQGIIQRNISRVMKGFALAKSVEESTQETSQDPLSQMPQPSKKSQQTALATARKQRQRAREKDGSIQPESSTRAVYQPIVSPSEV